MHHGVSIFFHSQLYHLSSQRTFDRSLVLPNHTLFLSIGQSNMKGISVVVKWNLLKPTQQSSVCKDNHASGKVCAKTPILNSVQCKALLSK